MNVIGIRDSRHNRRDLLDRLCNLYLHMLTLPEKFTIITTVTELQFMRALSLETFKSDISVNSTIIYIYI